MLNVQPFTSKIEVSLSLNNLLPLLLNISIFQPVIIALVLGVCIFIALFHVLSIMSDVKADSQFIVTIEPLSASMQKFLLDIKLDEFIFRVQLLTLIKAFLKSFLDQCN
jgi:hypothetical protein